MSDYRVSRRGLLLGAVGLGTAGILASCSSKSNTPTPSSSSSTTNAALTGTLSALFMKQAGYSDEHIGAMITAFTAKNPGVTIKPEYVPYEALHDKIVAAAPAGTYDLVFIDVIWPAEFASKGLIADISSRIPSTWKTDVLGGALNSAVYNGKYYGVPWLLDTKYFFWNEDHLAKAGVDKASLATWDGVATAAKAIKSKAGIRYPLIWSWAQAEAVICDWTAMTADFGGKIFTDAGVPAFADGGALQALEFMRKTVVDGITNPSSMQTLEDDVRKVISAGDASMGLNWTYMYSAANDPKQSKMAGKIAIGEVPTAGGGHMSVNGSSALSITANSKNPDAAWAFAEFVSSRAVQEQYVADSLPIWSASYNSPAVIKSAPNVVPVAKRQLADMVNRPGAVQYNAVSQKLQVAIQKALTGAVTPAKALKDAEVEVNKLLAG